MSPSRWKIGIVMACAFFGVANRAEAKKGIVLVVVQDAQGQCVEGVKIGIQGGGDAQRTGPDGKALLTLAKDTKENDWIDLEIIESPAGEDFVIPGPANRRQRVPPFEDKAENYVVVMVIPRSVFVSLMIKPRMRELARRIPAAPPRH